MTWPDKSTRVPKRVMAKAIYLTGLKTSGYRIITSGYDGLQELDVPTARVGNAFVKALRDIATERPDLFPPSRLQAAFDVANPRIFSESAAWGCAIERAFGDRNDVGG